MAEYIKVPAGVYDMVTRCMEQEFPDHVAIRYVAEDGKTVVEKKYREYAQDIRRMVAYLKAEVPEEKDVILEFRAVRQRSAEPELL